ncbi:MAG: DUF2793 domain-containing protein [Pseudomonadota bacterium]
MTDTPQLALPLLSPAQAQKHVTVNEALSRLDGMVQLRLVSLTETVPPAVFAEGDCYAVPTGAVNAWAGAAGRIAIAANGGWDFVDPRDGFRAFVLDQGVEALYDGAEWVAGGLTRTAARAGMAVASAETDLTLSAGPSATTAPIIPERALVFGVTGVVTAPITGATAWRVGVASDDARFGSGIGLATGAWVTGPANPIPYWSATALQVTAEGGDFTGGAVRLAVHYMVFTSPDAT